MGCGAIVRAAGVCYLVDRMVIVYICNMYRMPYYMHRSDRLNWSTTEVQVFLHVFLICAVGGGEIE